MSKREKCTYEEKIKAVEDYLNGVRNQKQIATDLGLGKRGRWQCEIFSVNKIFYDNG